MDSKIIAIVVAAIVIVAGVGIYFVAVDDSDENPDNGFIGSNKHLEIFGNANGDYYLDDKDVKIIQDHVDGKTLESDLIKVKEDKGNKVFYLADANIDGKVDAEDVTYLKSLIDRSAEKMNFIDTFGNLVKAPLKIDRIAVDYFGTAEMLKMVGVTDKVVAAQNALIVLSDFYLEGADMSKVKNYYNGSTPDFELVALADPDVWICASDNIDKYSEKTDAVIIGLDMKNYDYNDIEASSNLFAALLAGHLFNNLQPALDYVEWYLGTYKMLNDVTSTISEKDRPDVFLTMWSAHIVDPSNKLLRLYNDKTIQYKGVELAGGRNILDNHPNSSIGEERNLDLEWVVDQEYDFVFAHVTKYQGNGLVYEFGPHHGYNWDNTTEYRTAQNHLRTVEALTGSVSDTNNMYLTPGDFPNGASGGMLNAVLYAKVLHPDLFKDLDIQTVHQEYINIMGGNGYDLNKSGVFFLENN